MIELPNSLEGFNHEELELLIQLAKDFSAIERVLTDPDYDPLFKRRLVIKNISNLIESSNEWLGYLQVYNSVEDLCYIFDDKDYKG